MRSDAAFIKREFDNYVEKEFSSARTFASPANSEYRMRAVRIASRGAVVSAYIIQANFNLYQRGPGTDYPCLVLMTFDAARLHDRAFMQPIVEKLQSLKGTRQSEPDLITAARIVTNETAVRDRRQLVPPSLTGGVTVYAVDLQLYRARLATGAITDGEVICLAEPGPEGGAEQVPYWITMGMTAAQGQAELPVGARTESRPLSQRLNSLPSSVFEGRSRSGLRLGALLVIPVISILLRASYWAAQSPQRDDDDPRTGYTHPVAPQAPDTTPPAVYRPPYTPPISTYTPPPSNEPGPYMPSDTPSMSDRRFPGSFGVNSPGAPGYRFGPRRSPYFSGPDSSIPEPPNPYAGIKLPPGFTIGPGGAPIPPSVRTDPQPNPGGYTPPASSTPPPPDAGTPPQPAYGGAPNPGSQQPQPAPPPSYGGDQGTQQQPASPDQSGGGQPGATTQQAASPDYGQPPQQ